MKSLRLLTISSLVDKDDIVLDVGCDHGYLAIYLKKNNLCKDVLASDVSEQALNTAKRNFKNNNLQIKTFLTDGLQGITDYYNTVVLAGMGTHTIIKILSKEELPPKIILASNNDYSLLRTFMNNLGYKIKCEKVVYENQKYYDIILYIKEKETLTKKELLFGKSKNLDYYKYLYNKNSDIIKKVPFKKKIQLLNENKILKKLIRSIEKM